MDTDNNDQNLLNVDANTSSSDMSVLEVSTNQDDTLNYQTADEENSSKYFSMIEGDSTLEGSCSENVTLDSKSDLNASSIIESESSSKPSQMLNSLANLTIESVNKLHIHERIDAANILSGGVDIFDDNENSLDEHELVIDDDAHPSEKSNDFLENSAEVSGDMGYKGSNLETTGEVKETETNFNKHFELFKKSGDEEIISEESAKSVTAVVSKESCEAPKKEVAEEVQEAEVKTDNYSALLQSNLPEGSSEVTLVIDDKNTEAIDIGEGVFIYKRDDGELTAIQITMNEEGVTNFKCLHVGKNEDGNLEVYEEQVNQVPVTNEELESMKAKELSNADETVNIQSMGEIQLKDSSTVSETVEIQKLGEVQLKAISIVSETVDLRTMGQVQPKDISFVSEIVNIQSTEEQLKDISIVNESVDILQNTDEEVQLKDVSTLNETVEILQNTDEEVQLKDISIVNETVGILQNTDEEVQPKDISIVNETVDILQNTDEEVQLKDISIVNETVDILQNTDEEVQLKDISIVNETVDILQNTDEEVQLKDISIVNETVGILQNTDEEVQPKDISIVNETVDILQNTDGEVQLKDISIVNETVDILQNTEEEVQLKDISIVNETVDILQNTDEEVQLKEISIVNETVDILQNTDEVQLKEISIVNETVDILQNTDGEVQLKDISIVNETVDILQNTDEEVQLKDISIVNETVDILQNPEETQLKDISIVNEIVDIKSTGEVQLKDICTLNETTEEIQVTEKVQMQGKDISTVNETVDIQSIEEVIYTINETTEDIQIMGKVHMQGKDISAVNETMDIQSTEEVQLKDTFTVNETIDIQCTQEVQLKDIATVNETMDIQSTKEVPLKEISSVNEIIDIQITQEIQLKDIATVNETMDIQSTEEVPLKEIYTNTETMNIQSTEEVPLKDISTVDETIDVQIMEELQLKDNVNVSVDIQSPEKEQLKDISTAIETADSQSTEEVQLKEISQDKAEVPENGETPELVTENANSECEVEAEEAENLFVNLASPVSSACDIVPAKSVVNFDTASIDNIAEEDVIESATVPSISISTSNENLNSTAEVKTLLEPCLEVQLTKDEFASSSSCVVSSDPDIIEKIILTVVDTKEELDHPKPASVSEPAESTHLSSPQEEKVASDNDFEDEIDVEDSENFIECENVQVSSLTKIPLSDVKNVLPREFFSGSIENSDKLLIVECSTEANTSTAISEIIEVNDIDNVDSSSFNATSPLSPKLGIVYEVESSKNDAAVSSEVTKSSDEPNLKQDVVPEEVITLGTICDDDSKLLSSSEPESNPAVIIESSSEPSVTDLVMGPEEWLESEEPEIKLNDATIPEIKPLEVMEIDEESSEPNIIELSDDDSDDTQIETDESAKVKDCQAGLTEKVVSEIHESSIEAKNKSIEVKNKSIDIVTSNIPSFTNIVSTNKITPFLEKQNQNTERGRSPLSPKEIPVLQISDTSDSDDIIEMSLADKPTIQSIISENLSVKIISLTTEEDPEKDQKSSKMIDCSDSMKSSESNVKNSSVDTSPLKALQSQSSVESEDDLEDDDYVEGEPVTGDSGVEWIAANSSQYETVNVKTATTLEKPTVQHTADLKFKESSGEPNDTCDVDKGVAAPCTESQEVSDNNNDISVDGLSVKKVIDVKAIQSTEKNVVSEVDFDKFVRRNSIPLSEVCNSTEFEDVSQTVRTMSVSVLEEECEIVEISTLPVKEMPLPTLSNNGVKIASSVTTQPSQREMVVNKKAISPREVSTYKPTLPQLYRSPVKEKSNYTKNLSPPLVQSAQKQIIPNKSALLQKGDVKILTKYTESPSQPFTNVSKLRTYSPSHKLNSNPKPASIQNRSQQNAFREVDKMRVVQTISSPRPHQLLVQANSPMVANVSLVGHTITDYKDKSPGANRHIMHHKNKSPVANRDTIMDRKDKSPGTNLNIILDHKNKSPGINRNPIMDYKDKSSSITRNTITDHKDKSPVANIDKTSATNIISVKIPIDTETISSAEDSPNSEQKPQAKCRQPRKQVFTPVTRSDMEIIFPNLYSNAEEYKKESEAKALKMTYKLKERDIRFKQLSKKDPVKNILDKSPKTSPNTTLSPGSKSVTNIDLSLSPERESKVQKNPEILKSDSAGQTEIMNLDNSISNSPLSSSAKRKRGRPKKNQTILTDVLKSDEDTPLKKHLPNEKSDTTVKDVPVELAESPVKKVEKEKESPVTEVMKTKITPIKEGTDLKEIPIKEVTNAKETLVQEVTDAEETPFQEVTEAKVTSVKDVSKAKEASAKEVSKVKEAFVEEVLKAKETSVNEIINVKETAFKEITKITELPAKEVPKTKETVDELLKSKENPAKEVTRTKPTLEKGTTISKESPLREVAKPKESPFQEASKSENSPRTYPISPFGKINDNIKCPMCFKTFRTENVLLKHVKHCNGIIDIETIKSPRKRKIITETPKDDLSCNTPEKKSTEHITQDCDKLKITATKGAKPEIVSDVSDKTETKLNPSLSDNLPKKRGRKPKVAVLNDEIPENKSTKSGTSDSHTDPKKPVKCENIPEKKGLQVLTESPKIKSIEPVIDPSFEVLHLKETFDHSDKANIYQHRGLDKELSNELSPERKKVISDDSGNDSVIIMESVKMMPSKSLLETITIEDSFSSSPLNHKFENNVVDKSVEKVEASLGTVKEESKMVLPGKRDSDEHNNSTKIAKSISDKASKEKTIGGGKKLLEKPPAAMASPMSRLAKMKNTKPVVNSPIECEICGKTFRQLAHMVYHRTKHTVDEPEPEPIPPVETPKATTPKKPVVTEEQVENSVEPETMLKCEICQKGFRKLHHLVEHRELHTNSESRSRRTSVASVKSETESAGFRCDTCDKSFRKLHHLVEHRELHIAEALQSLPQLAVETKPIEDATCSGCGKSFRKRHHMVEHRDIHCSPSKKGKPDDSSNDNNIRLSVASSTSEDGNNCGICGKSYRKLHHMVEHRESHIEVREEKSTNMPEVLNTKDIIHECSRCYMVFPNENSLIKHVTICSRKKLLNKSKSVQQEMMHLIDDVDVLPVVPNSTQREDRVSESSGTASKLEPVITESTSKLESVIMHVPDNNQLNKSNNVSDQNIAAKDQDVEVTVSAIPAALNVNVPLPVPLPVPIPLTNERAPPNRPGRRSLFSNDILRTQVSKRKSLNIDPVSSKSQEFASVPTNLNAGVQRPLRKSLVARSQESSKIEESEKRLYTFRNLRKSTSSVDTVTSRTSSRRSINSTTSVDSKDPIRKTISSKDPTASKLKIPLRKSLISGIPANSSSIKAKPLAPVKTASKVGIRKSSIQSKDDEPDVKYMIKEPKHITEPQPKYKINPEFNKPIRRLSQPLAPKNVSKTIIKSRKRVSESALSGLKLPSAKMLKAIIEESDIRYSFPKSPKLKSESMDQSTVVPSTSSSSTKKPISAKVGSQLPKMNENTKKTKKVISSVLMSQKRKSLGGGRNSMEGRKLPGLAKKAAATLQLRCCRQIFTSQANLSVHRKTHKVVRQAHKCDCGKAFDTEGLLKRHIHTEHTPPKSFKCTDCGASVRTAAQFAKHKKDHQSHPPKANATKVLKTTTKLQTESVPKIKTKDTKKVPAKTEEVGAGSKKGVKRKIAHGGVPLSDKMRKAMAGVKF